jgi:hypothetical protein
MAPMAGDPTAAAGLIQSSGLSKATGLQQVLAFSTAGDAANGLLFGWDIASFQNWALIYLGVSSLAFVLVWVVGYLRRSG